MSCRYTLLLRYGTNKFYLAPRSSVLDVEEDKDLETVEDTSCCGQARNRTWKIKAHFLGNCSLASAWALFNSLQIFLNAACASDLIIERTVCDEPALIYKVTKVSPRMTDVINQYTKQRVLTMEITFSLTTWIEAGNGAVLVGS
jgi:hypothetical protein